MRFFAARLRSLVFTQIIEAGCRRQAQQAAGTSSKKAERKPWLNTIHRR